MRNTVLLTLTGNDRIGLVEEVTGLLLNIEANIEASRMAHLGGEFAMLALVSVPEDRVNRLDNVLQNLVSQGFKVTFSPTIANQSAEYSNWLRYQIEIKGADHEGIIHEFAQHLRQFNINIETAETEVVNAPMSGTPLFSMSAIVSVPQIAENAGWISDLDEVANHHNVDVLVIKKT
jgi:glycine cleavage system transcriptional repressor